MMDEVLEALRTFRCQAEGSRQLIGPKPARSRGRFDKSRSMGERGACDPRACGRGRTQPVFQQSILGVHCMDTSCALVRLCVQAHRVRVREWMRLKWKTANPLDASAPRGGGQSQPAGSRSPRPGAAPRARRRKAIAGKQSAGPNKSEEEAGGGDKR